MLELKFKSLEEKIFYQQNKKICCWIGYGSVAGFFIAGFTYLISFSWEFAFLVMLVSSLILSLLFIHLYIENTLWVFREHYLTINDKVPDSMKTKLQKILYAKGSFDNFKTINGSVELQYSIIRGKCFIKIPPSIRAYLNFKDASEKAISTLQAKLENDEQLGMIRKRNLNSYYKQASS